MGFRKSNRVIVIERDNGKVKVVEAVLSDKAVSVRRAVALPDAAPLQQAQGKSGATAADSQLFRNNHAEVVLLANSNRSVCRLMKLPAASAEDTHRMAALRLETELPYPVADSLWACGRLNGAEGDAQPAAFALATPAAEVAESERVLGFKGRNPWTVQLDVAALAELAADAAPDETVALCRVREHSSDLVIVHKGRLQYARRIFGGCGNAAGNGTFQSLGGELDQCVHHYGLSSDEPEPKRLLLVGEGARVEGLAEALSARMGMPVERLSLPRAVHLDAGVAAGDELLERHPACLGALLAALRAKRGDAAAAPALRRRRPPMLASLRNRRGALVCACVVLLAALVAVSFMVRKARIGEAVRAVRQGQPFLQDIDRLQNEVDALEYEKRLQRPMLDTLLALSETLPKSLKIATLNVSPSGKIAISGTCPSVEEASDKAMDALKGSKVFANPKFLGATKQDQEFRFRLTCELKNAAKGGTP